MPPRARNYAKRSEAAKKGWAKRRTAKGTSRAGEFGSISYPMARRRPVVLDKADSSLEGMYWNVYGEALGG